MECPTYVISETIGIDSTRSLKNTNRHTVPLQYYMMNVTGHEKKHHQNSTTEQAMQKRSI